MFGFSFFSPAVRQTLHFTFFRHTLRTATFALLLACVCCAPLVGAGSAAGQTIGESTSSLERRLKVGAEPEIVVRNLRGRVQVTTADADATERIVLVNAITTAGATLAESDVVTERGGGRVTITVAEAAAGARASQRRVDLAVRVPARARVSIEAAGGAVDVVGDFQKVEARTTTGTIRVDVPSAALRYDFEWTAARPRVYSLLDLAKVRENRGGRYSISGQFPPKRKAKNAKDSERASVDATDDEAGDTADVPTSDAANSSTGDGRDAKTKKNDDKRARRKLEREQRVELRFTTERGVVIIGADPATVPADLRERTLTEAARLFIRSGNETLIDRVRRLAPNLVDEYAGTLATRRAGGAAPMLAVRGADATNARQPTATTTARLAATVTDRAGHPLIGLTKDDFAITVDGVAGEVTQVTESDAPFNLVLLLDVSGSVEERLDFIRRAALRFVQTASARDRVSIITFRDDVANISDFTADRAELTRRINTINAGGATALYDALAYTLLDPLRRLTEAEVARTAIVILSDGDDNRSFLSYRNVLDLTRETGTPVYPLYVPSGLIPTTISTASTVTGSTARSEDGDASPSPNLPTPSAAAELDPTRSRFLTLTTIAAQQGATLAQETGGVFYPIARLEELQNAYDDIVRQLRTSYTITYRVQPDAAAQNTDTRHEPQGIRLRVRRAGAVVARTGLN